MAEKHEQAKIDYENGMKYKDIAIKYDVSLDTVKKWKTRHEWTRDVHKKKSTQKNKKCTPKKPVSKLPIKVEHTTKEDDGLTEKQRLFCQLYVRNFNATQAYLKAYQCSYNVANVEGYNHLVKPSIRNEIQRLKDIKSQSLMLSEDDIVERYMRIAFADMGDFAEWGIELIPAIDKTGCMLIGEDGNVKYHKVSYLDFKNHNEVDSGLVSEVSLGKQGMKVKLQDQQKALDWLSNYFNMNPMNKHKMQFDNRVIALREKESARDDW